MRPRRGRARGQEAEKAKVRRAIRARLADGSLAGDFALAIRALQICGPGGLNDPELAGQVVQANAELAERARAFLRKEAAERERVWRYRHPPVPPGGAQAMCWDGDRWMPLVRPSTEDEETESRQGVVGAAEYVVARQRALDILERLLGINPDTPELWAALEEVRGDFPGAGAIVDGLTRPRPEQYRWGEGDERDWFGPHEIQ